MISSRQQTNSGAFKKMSNFLYIYPCQSLLYIIIFQKSSQNKMIIELESLKEIVPEFIIKLYHILEKKQFEDFIAWSDNGEQIHIKNAKKLEQKVLPFFFRHKHITSFIRQLNMYKFGKVNKISKQRSHMYFKNPNFIKGDIQRLKSIKRTQKQKKNEKNQMTAIKDALINKQQSLQSNTSSYICDYQTKLRQLYEIIYGISEKYPQTNHDLQPAINICLQMITPAHQIPLIDSVSDLIADNLDDAYDSKIFQMKDKEANMDIQSFILPSICSLSNLDS